MAAAYAAAPYVTAGFPAWSTGVRVAVTDVAALDEASTLVRALLADVDAAASRFRPDSELSHLVACAGTAYAVSPLLWELLDAAIRAARLTDGLVDPTLGPVLASLGYDRSFEQLTPARPGPALSCHPVGWQALELDRAHRAVRLPAGGGLDLGATAKAWTADKAAAAVHRVTGCGALVSIGGDISVAGDAPTGGWPVQIADDHTDASAANPVVGIEAGGLATSSITVRSWRRGGRSLHHILDPATGLPTRGRWRTVSVAARSCLDANIAATAAIVAGDGARAWLTTRALPARLVDRDGTVVTVVGWPAEPPR